MTSVLIITGSPIGTHMAGPALRAWNIARVLTADHHRVTLATTGDLVPHAAPFAQVHLEAGDDRAFRRLEEAADVIVFQGIANMQFPSLRRSTKILVADLYDAMHIEQLEWTRTLGETHSERVVLNATWIVDEQLLIADFILCSSDRQRHLYLGHLAAFGRITPGRYRGDPDLARLIAIAPFGLDPELPTHDRAAMRGVVPGIGLDDKILIWAGGIYEWFDPQTLIRAVGSLAAARPDLRLFFVGTRTPGQSEMPVVAESRRLADELGLTGTSVFFNEGWVPWQDRHNYLLEADAGVSTHLAHLETEFSFRTRILDYLWAALPLVLTAGDMFGDLTTERGLGAVVDAMDVAALASAIESVVYDPAVNAASRTNVAETRAQFAWEKTLSPLRAFVADPQPSPDRMRGGRGIIGRAARGVRPIPTTTLGRYRQRARQVLDREGLGGILRRVVRR
ncbi:MAG: glycosyltransferase family 4 protein [Acidobacteria bacterium]|nr:glycosyltransferase family 4 protein [Acidobacteriota bacterium]